MVNISPQVQKFPLSVSCSVHRVVLLERSVSLVTRLQVVRGT